MHKFLMMIFDVTYLVSVGGKDAQITARDHCTKIVHVVYHVYRCEIVKIADISSGKNWKRGLIIS